ncbi:carbohydrate ABC transporter permease [Gryllotalpicola ginsengisoli]|uniref:carbohydrate ABC transporter permease n=1 Tax=Gryllotalpicola ginsengisoli TaxID=444608 RepID=UPI0003B6826E|nr:sugar ABC transporter permease [Gryllotalpicola ginsengisoli]
MTSENAAARLRARRSRRSRNTKSIWKGLAFASPFLLGFVVLIAYPMLASAFYSFTDFNLFQAPKWVGLANYRHMFGDSTFWHALWNTLYLSVIGVPLTIIIGLLGAHILNFRIRGQAIYRALVYVPVIVPVVVGSYLWRWMLNSQYGYVDRLLQLVGLPQPSWLTEPQWGKPAILLIALWTIGSTIIIYLAAIRDVPQDLYEAAQMDGAGPWRRFFSITWPQLTPVTLFQIIVVMISYLQIFTQPYLLTQTTAVGNGSAASGGAGDSMLSLSMYLFQNAFTFLKMGYASAMAWVLFVLTMLITLILLWSSRRWVHYDNPDD